MSTLQKIAELKENAIQRINKKEADKTIVFVGSATCENAAGAIEVMNKFTKFINENNLENKVILKKTGCTGFCADEPIVQIVDSGNKTIYKRITSEKVKDIVEKHLEKGEVIKEWEV